VSHIVAALPFTFYFFKVSLWQKKNLWKPKYFIMQKKKKKNPLKETKILQDMYILEL
jgi:hypothetical protein